MTIKKTIKIKPKGSPSGASASGGSAVLADRFKLDADAASAKPVAKAGNVTGLFGLVALAVAGILTYMLWQHWEFLMPA